MMNQEDILKRLTDKDDKSAYEFTKQLIIESKESAKYLELIPIFAGMLQDKNSYIRTRGFCLICHQARWANERQIEAVFKQMVPLLNDPKPTVVRQCLGALQEIVVYRPEMMEEVKESLSKIEVGQYKDGVSPLIQKDIDSLRKIEV